MNIASAALVLMLIDVNTQADGDIQALSLYFRGSFHCSYDYVSFRSDGTVVRESEGCARARGPKIPISTCVVREGRTAEFSDLSLWVVGTLQQPQPEEPPAPHSTREVTSSSTPGAVLTITRGSKETPHHLVEDRRSWAIEKVIHGTLADVDWVKVREVSECPSARRGR